MGHLHRSLLAAALAAVLVAGCGDDDETTAGSTTTSSATSTSTTSTTTTSSSTEPEADPVPVDPTWTREEGTWMVWGVAPDDVLNVRADADPSAPVVTSLDPDATGITRFTATTNVGRETWSPIEVDGGAGWVNTRFLRPEPPEEPELHGDVDEELADAAEEVRDAIQAGDHAALAELAHPRGVTFSTQAFVDETSPVLSQSQLREAEDDDTEVLWGHTDGEGAPIRQTITERLEEIAGSTALTSTTDIGFDERIGTSNTVDNLTEWFPGAHFVEYHHEGTGEQADFNWASVRFVFDTASGGPLLVGVVQDTWTI